MQYTIEFWKQWKERSLSTTTNSTTTNSTTTNSTTTNSTTNNNDCNKKLNKEDSDSDEDENVLGTEKELSWKPYQRIDDVSDHSNGYGSIMDFDKLY